jgi:GTP pyrophosphokinase
MLACTDAVVQPKPPWKERKEVYLEHLRSARAEALLVSCADKLHNAQSILADYKDVGDEVFERFSASKNAVLWYYRELADIFSDRLAGPLACKLERTVAELEQLTSAATKAPFPEP